MTDDDKAQEVIEKIKHFRERLSEILTDAASNRDFLTVVELLKRWKQRTAQYLRDHVSEKEASNLLELEIVSTPLKDCLKTLESEVRLYDSVLKALMADIRDDPAILRGSMENPTATATADSKLMKADTIPQTKKVFLVHGHDEVNTMRLRDLLRDRFRLEPVILANQPGRGRTLIEKFEGEAQSCSFAFVLLTSDDQVATGTGEYTQARPNVLFELGWFYGRLGRERVVLLLRGATRIHSDLDGVSRIEFDKNVEEKVLEMEAELKAAGLL